MKDVSYSGIRARQRSSEQSPVFFTFYARAKEIHEWVGVERTKDKDGAVQRVLRPARLSGIQKFLASDARNTLPNNILIAFNPGAVTYTPFPHGQKEAVENECGPQLELGSISFRYDPGAPDSDRPALLVDGQHRLFGADRFVAEDLPMLVVGILEATTEEQAFQFIVINNKAVRVPAPTVKSIVADFDAMEAGLTARLLPAGITYGRSSPFLSSVNESDESPFKGLLKWDRNRDGEQEIEVTTAEGLLSQLKRELVLNIGDDEDSAQSILFWIWAQLAHLYEDIWNERNAQFFSKVNMLAMNEYCLERLRHIASMQMVDLFDRSQVREATNSVFRNIPSELWKREWNGIKLQDNKAVRDFLKTTFETVATNCIADRPWTDQLKLIGEK